MIATLAIVTGRFIASIPERRVSTSLKPRGEGGNYGAEVRGRSGALDT